MRLHDDSGSAVVEFLAGTVLLLVPLVYLTVTLGEIQAATFAVHTAAREAARAVQTSADPAVASARARTAVDLALDDQGVAATAEVRVQCSADPCVAVDAGSSAPQTTVTALVRAEVPLPGVPAFLAGALPLRIPVGAEVAAPVDPFRAAP